MHQTCARHSMAPCHLFPICKWGNLGSAVFPGSQSHWRLEPGVQLWLIWLPDVWAMSQSTGLVRDTELQFVRDTELQTLAHSACASVRNMPQFPSETGIESFLALGATKTNSLQCSEGPLRNVTLTVKLLGPLVVQLAVVLLGTVLLKLQSSWQLPGWLVKVQTP